MKYFIFILISLFSLSCEDGDIKVLIESNRILMKRCDSLQNIINHPELIRHRSDIKFYIIDDKFTLLKRNIISRVSGLSRDVKVNNRVKKHYFQSAHISQIDTLDISGRYVNVIGHFNPDTYTIIENGDNHQLIIKNRDKFWKYSNFLVIIKKDN